eukprot:1007-Heterococcus_DN1.PRE.2
MAVTFSQEPQKTLPQQQCSINNTYCWSCISRVALVDCQITSALLRQLVELLHCDSCSYRLPARCHVMCHVC